jgi:hypothetical protein
VEHDEVPRDACESAREELQVILALGEEDRRPPSSRARPKEQAQGPLWSIRFTIASKTSVSPALVWRAAVNGRMFACAHVISAEPLSIRSRRTEAPSTCVVATREPPCRSPPMASGQDRGSTQRAPYLGVDQHPP